MKLAEHFVAACETVDAMLSEQKRLELQYQIAFLENILDQKYEKMRKSAIGFDPTNLLAFKDGMWMSNANAGLYGDGLVRYSFDTKTGKTCNHILKLTPLGIMAKRGVFVDSLVRVVNHPVLDGKTGKVVLTQSFPETPDGLDEYGNPLKWRPASYCIGIRIDDTGRTWMIYDINNVEVIQLPDRLILCRKNHPSRSPYENLKRKSY